MWVVSWWRIGCCQCADRLRWAIAHPKGAAFDPTLRPCDGLRVVVDDDLDGYISKEEFQIMYKRCVSDETGLEPRKLYNLTQFMMYDKSNRG